MSLELMTFWIHRVTKEVAYLLNLSVLENSLALIYWAVIFLTPGQDEFTDFWHIRVPENLLEIRKLRNLNWGFLYSNFETWRYKEIFMLSTNTFTILTKMSLTLKRRKRGGGGRGKRKRRSSNYLAEESLNSCLISKYKDQISTVYNYTYNYVEL